MATTDVQERPQRRDELAAWYSEVLREQETSGLSVAEYAMSLGLAATTLYQWKRRLARTTRSRPERSVRRTSPEGLLQISLPQKPTPSVQAGLVVRLGGGRSVEVPDDFDDEVLARLLTVLERC